jgi:[ribosomal protein S18]-alanine N-acetyltransferase
VKARLAVLADVASMMAIEHASPMAAHWSERQYLELFESTRAERLALVVDLPSTNQQDTSFQFVGFLVARHIASEWELENIAVAPAALRQGVARHLLETLITHACAASGAAIFLEVRESNIAARGLYETLGFRTTGRRAAYYDHPPEDAILYRIDLRPTE